MFPLRNKLAYWFSRATGDGKRYSPVYSRHGYEHVWAEIDPVRGCHDRFVIRRCLNTLDGVRNGNIFRLRDYREFSSRQYVDEQTKQSSFSAEETAAVLKKLESQWERQGYAVRPGQPFAGRIFQPRPSGPA